MRVLKPAVQNLSPTTGVQATDLGAQKKVTAPVSGPEVSGWQGQAAAGRGPPSTSAHLGVQVGFLRTVVLGPVMGAMFLLGGCATTGSSIPEDRAPVQQERPAAVEARAPVTEVNASLLGTAKGVVQAAQFLIDQHSSSYEEDSPWLNLDPNHALPANVRLGGMSGKSKCNLFVSQALYLGGFEPPRYGNGEKGEYANANQIWKWSDIVADKYGNPERFKMVSQVSLLDLPYDKKVSSIAEVLRKAEPGDLVLVDHGPSSTGEKVINRGHARLVMDNPLARGGSEISISNATDAKGAVRQNKRPSDLASEDHVWVLRPSQPRIEKTALEQTIH